MKRITLAIFCLFYVMTACGAADYVYWQSAQTEKGLEISRTKLATVTRDAPPSKASPIEVTPKSVKDAARYQILRIPSEHPGTLAITVENKGNGTLYYWLVGHMGLFRSPIAGPFVANGCDIEKTKNKVKVVSGAFSYPRYTILCTNSAQMPAGMMHVMNAWEISAKEYVDTRGMKNQAQYPCWPQGTSKTFPPVGQGTFLVGVSAGEAVQDTGELKSINLVPPRPLKVKTNTSGYADGEKLVECQNPGRNGVLGLKVKNTTPQGQYNWGGPVGMYIEQHDIAGGHNDYAQFPGSPRAKSFHIPFYVWQFNYTAGQMATQVMFGEKYGEGDNVLLTAHNSTEGLIEDGGDEGTEIFMTTSARKLKAYDLLLEDDAPAHTDRLPIKNIGGRIGGEGRVVVNLSQAVTAGAISQIDDDMVEDPHSKRTNHLNRVTRLTGKGTAWTPEMAGWYISLDCDTTKDGFRQWYRVRRVNSPTSLDIHAYTYFSRSTYLGKASNVVYHGKEFRGGYKMEPRPADETPGTPEFAAKKKDEPYMLAPATTLSAPTVVDGKLNVLPIKETWKKGEKIQVVAGPQTALSLGKIGLHGKLLPQDFVWGLWLHNDTDRLSNDPGLMVMGRWSTGIGVMLDGAGLSNGVDVSGKASPKGAAFVAPADTNALRVRGVDLVLSGKAESGELVVSEKTHDGAPILSMNSKSVRVGQGKTFGGSDMLRGVVELSGDGKTTAFRCVFPGAFSGAPHVVASSNLPIGMGLTAMDDKGFTVTFAAPPAAGEKNIRITWIAME